ncbi:hypothetical protein Pmar_PMAR021814 [Perkinsus marinus ATCC 50983]|uniref:Uncharacterized protein n=1 Tax=Perkinsus marinus (strain ATCC 50983 / TXsc) TaxID=423536 RepID=C5LG53_PERM5|nr:hypothetical protein Pmar_PMAR021814 [Perkinsus marinus ATCC 50983]EER04308.1 hypothetical protein Pmar_PMAR021814 [Perkinsus marinus ATCC 50983]|eukprot:XP_002772492.1 hypothetical protein Pmar_PMAR021814 [Perkinsus marinus ATCC 50983]
MLGSVKVCNLSVCQERLLDMRAVWLVWNHHRPLSLWVVFYRCPPGPERCLLDSDCINGDDYGGVNLFYRHFL